MIEAIEAAGALGSVRTVVFSGGECFLTFESLVESIERATALGMNTRCVSNGYWAKNIDRGRVMLHRLRAAGLKELNISTGDQHRRFVTLQAVENAAVLGVEANMVTRVVVEERVGREETAATFSSRPVIRELLARGDKGRRESDFDVLESPWMPMDHRKSIDSNRLLDVRKLPGCNGCSSIFTTIVRSPEGNLGICCGLPRRMIPEMNRPFDAANLEVLLQHAGGDFLKIWLFTDGPEKILAWAASHDPKIVWENRFAHQCHACLAIFKDERVGQVVREHYRERVDDVLLRYSAILNRQSPQSTAVSNLTERATKRTVGSPSPELVPSAGGVTVDLPQNS